MVYFRNIDRYLKDVVAGSQRIEDYFYYRGTEAAGIKVLRELGILGKSKKVYGSDGYSTSMYAVDMEKAERCLQRLYEIAEQSAAEHGYVRANVKLSDIKTE